jgi:hypothetical protein
MFIIQSHSDGSASYGYERGDSVILKRTINLHDLYGGIYKTYPEGSVVKITGRGRVSGTRLIPDILESYDFNFHGSCSAWSLKPEKPELALPKPEAYVVYWQEYLWVRKNKRVLTKPKYSLVAARNCIQAEEICFSAKHFTPERMAEVEVLDVFRQSGWILPEDERWISIIPLR